MLNGRLGQVIGPFAANVDLLSDAGPIGQFTPETTKPVIYKLGIQAFEGTEVEINDTLIVIGKTGIYELDGVVDIKKIVFPNGADDDTIIDFIY